MKLLSPIMLGKVTVKNRVVSTAHAAYKDFFSPTSSGDRYIEYQERRAQGGTGLIIMTAMHVHPTSQNPGHWVFDAATQAPKFRRIADRVHAHGAKIVAQLFHFGQQGRSDSHDDLVPIWSFSGLPTLSGEATHEMSDGEIEEVIDAFVLAAKVAVDNGIDGIELHGTHGYLIQQSFSPRTNRRTDRWGEPLYFTRTLAERVREAIGNEFILGFRISADDFVRPADGGLGPSHLATIASTLVSTGWFDYLNHSEGSGGAHYARAIGSYRHPLGEYLPLTRGLRAAIKAAVPLIGVGKIATPDLAERAILDGTCDLVGMTRSQIADPDLVSKLQAGQAHRIRLCTGSNQGCIDRARANPITCFHNPEVGEEGRFRELDRSIAQAKKVLVVGGGPAGMKAAEVAARRGHHVVLAESSGKLGGRLNLVANVQHAASLLVSTSWIEQELAILGVDVRLQTAVDAEFVARESPESIVMATGALASSDLEAPTDGSVPTLSSDQAVAGEFDGNKLDVRGAQVLVVDKRGDYESALVVAAMAERGARVTVVTPYLHFGANMGFTNLEDYLVRLPKWGVDVRPTSTLVKVASGSAYVREAYSGAVSAMMVDVVVSGALARPCTALFEIFSRLAPTRMVGDVLAPRSALEAFREGDRAGRTL